jgi:hypothetical protein
MNWMVLAVPATSQNEGRRTANDQEFHSSINRKFNIHTFSERFKNVLSGWTARDDHPRCAGNSLSIHSPLFLTRNIQSVGKSRPQFKT